MDILYNKFRKAKIGGFNRKDVIDYIEKVQNEFFQYKIETENKVKELNEKISALETAAACREAIECDNAESFNTDTQELMPADEINLATGKLKNVADELCQSLSDFIEKITESSVAVMLNVPFEQQEEFTDGENETREDTADFKESDRVQSILSCASSMFTGENKAQKAQKNSEEISYTEKSVKDILNSAAFVC